MALDGEYRVLNVAEKNSTAESLAKIMAGEHVTKRDSYSIRNKIFEFKYDVLDRKGCKMVMTSVNGHLTNLTFGTAQNWNFQPRRMFTAPLHKGVKSTEESTMIEKTLEEEARRSQVLILWTDGDREGENIAFEISDVCKKANNKLDVYRARLSEITYESVTDASQKLARPDVNLSAAVETRQEVDLRIGAAFTCFLKNHLKRRFPEKIPNYDSISFGTCLFPTLGFVVHRYNEMKDSFKIKVTHETSDGKVEFDWKRDKVHDRDGCEKALQLCKKANEAEVVKVEKQPVTKQRPRALNTVELEKLAYRKFKQDAKRTMEIAERLYTQGFISYPRTDADVFSESINLTSLVERQTESPEWGHFANRILKKRGPKPRNGCTLDAHPPIHPTQYVNFLQGTEKRLYELIVRHFLACCSKDANGFEETVEIKVGEERFTAHGLQFSGHSYLGVYPYEEWKNLPIAYEEGQTFQPSQIEMEKGKAPAPLDEADLIDLMDKNSIGTKGTHAEHIDKMKRLNYVAVENGVLVPSSLGRGLVAGFDSMGFQLSYPTPRAELEADLKLICEGKKFKKEVVENTVTSYQQIFDKFVKQTQQLDAVLANYFGHPVAVICRCGESAVVRSVVEKGPNEGKEFYSCQNPKEMSCKSFVFIKEVCANGLLELDFRVKCNCNDFAALRTVKEGVNKGRLFFVCQKHKDSPLKCRFFKWADQPAAALQPEPEEDVTCRCGEQAAFRTVKKEGPTKGREFYGCQKAKSCGIFVFADELRANGLSELDFRVKCECNDFAACHTAKTEDNKGRLFFTCKKKMDSPSKCTFYQWADKPLASPQPEPEENVTCRCGEPAAFRTVKKEGPNKGRKFYACKKPRGSSCGSFVFADDLRANSIYELDFRVECDCNGYAGLRTSNEGRLFFVCDEPIDSPLKCQFFQWADEVEDPFLSSSALGSASLSQEHSPTPHHGGLSSFSDSKPSPEKRAADESVDDSEPKAKQIWSSELF